MRTIFSTFLALFFLSCLFAEEKINYFHSDILVQENGKLLITEKVNVNAEGYKIKRGIFRILPTTYEASYGLVYKVDYDFKKVLKDGKEEPWKVQKNNSSKTLYIGEENVLLNKGNYTYTIQYETDNQIGFYDEFDELYWNINGVEWNFEIDSLSAKIVLPYNTNITEFESYIGKFGDNSTDNGIKKKDGNTLTFSTKNLNPYENMTVRIRWNKGIVEETNQFLKLAIDNFYLIIGILGLIVLLIYFLSVWSKVGVDPPKGPIFPLFKAPKDLSPAAVRYIYKMNFDHKGFTAIVLSLATKGFIKINQDEDEDYKLEKIKPFSDNLSKEELKVAEILFRDGDLLELKNKNHGTIKAAIRALEFNLENSFEAMHFKLNRGYLTAGGAIAILFFGTMLYLTTINFIPVLLSSGIFIGVIIRVKAFLKSMQQNSIFNKAKNTILTVVFLLLFIGSFSFLTNFASILFTTIVVFYCASIFLFSHLLKAPTIFGRKIMDEIEGFKMYLETAEAHEIKNTKSPSMSIELFEEFLPFAIALNCEAQWTKKFENALKTMDFGNKENKNYRPRWYGGNFNAFKTASFASNIGSGLNNALTHSSRAPSTRSSSGGGFSGGGFGGGFSGGGGGGGGGGGW